MRYQENIQKKEEEKNTMQIRHSAAKTDRTTIPDDPHGYIMVKIKFLKEEDSKVISKIILYLIVPSVITAFQVDYPKHYEERTGSCMYRICDPAVLLLFVTWIMGKMFHLNTVEYTSAYYSNSGNLIVPLVTYILGKNGCHYCVFKVSIILHLDPLQM